MYVEKRRKIKKIKNREVETGSRSSRERVKKKLRGNFNNNQIRTMVGKEDGPACLVVATLMRCCESVFTGLRSCGTRAMASTGTGFGTS
jgi:hypothetical protein